MPELLTQDYPFFKAGSPLRSKDLNGLVQYLESEDRITRICLIGAGIMHGLKIELSTSQLERNNSFIKIKKGTGITSLGYVFCIDTDLAGGVQTEIILDKSEFSEQAAKVIFGDINTAQRLNSARVLNDALSNGIPNEDLMNKYVLLFYRLSGDESRSGCTTCEQNVLTESNILLITLNQTDYDTIKQQGCPLPPAGGTFQQSFPMMERFLNAETTFDEAQFIKRYQDISTPALTELKTLFTALNANAFLQELFNMTLPVNRLDNLLNYINTAEPLFIQYAYSYLRDLIKAYIEYAETPFGQTVNFLPGKHCFPRHLVLGKIVGGSLGLGIDYSERTPLYRPPFDDLRLDDLEHARTLFGRVADMLQHHILDENADSNFRQMREALRITPSHAVSTPLSKQAIPYYFNDINVRSRWSYRLQRTSRTQSIPFYDAVRTLMKQAPFDHADFYRIEGLVGKTLPQIKFQLGRTGDFTSELHELRKALQLPFDIVFCVLQQPIGRVPGRGISTLADYARENPGLEHQGGVPAGGTFVVVVNRSDNFNNPDGNVVTSAAVINSFTIVGDFCLPYICCGQAEEETTLADFMVESPNDFRQGTEGNLPFYVFDIPRVTSTLRIFFKNLSKNAETYEWIVDGQMQGTSIDFNSIFQTTAPHTVTLRAFKDGEFKDDYMQQVRFNIVEPPAVPVKANFIVESPNEFEQDERGYIFTVPPQAEALRIFFKNLSENGEAYEWFVGNTRESTDFDFNQAFAIGRARTYTVKLNALRGSAVRDSFTRTIRFRTTETVTANLTLNLLNAANLPFEVRQESTVYKNKPTVRFTLTLRNQQQQELPLQFRNLSSANAREFVWKTFDNQGNELNKNENLNINDLYSFLFSGLKPNIANDFVVEINAALGSLEDQQSLLLAIIVPRPVEPEGPPIVVVPPVVEPIVVEPRPRALSAEAGDVINQLRARHRDYRAAIRQAGESDATLSKTKSFIKAQGFLDAGDNIEALNKTFGEIAVQFIRNIKKEGGVSDDTYRLVLKNLVFFYLDKIAHVQGAGLSEATHSTLKDVFNKMKKENSFAALPALQSEWKAQVITTEQNETTVGLLNALFV